MNTMRKIYLILILLLGAIVINSCYDDVDEIVQQSKKGAVIATVEPLNTIFIVTDLENSATQFVFTTEGSFSKIDVEVQYRKTGSSAIVTTITQATTDTIDVTVPEIVAALGIDMNTLEAEEAFIISLIVTSPNGFSSRSASGQYFCYIACESSLEGTYDAITNGSSTDVDIANPVGTDIASEITLTKVDGITYLLDNSLGGIWEYWYCDLYGECSPIENYIQEFCGSLSGSWTDGYNVFDATGSVDPLTGVLTISWENDWGDKATTVLTPQ
jgi:hypothetical protein